MVKKIPQTVSNGLKPMSKLSATKKIPADYNKLMHVAVC